MTLVTNTTNETLVVDVISKKTGDIMPNGRSLRIAPGESADVPDMLGAEIRTLKLSEWLTAIGAQEPTSP